MRMLCPRDDGPGAGHACSARELTQQSACMPCALQASGQDARNGTSGLLAKAGTCVDAVRAWDVHVPPKLQVRFHQRENKNLVFPRCLESSLEGARKLRRDRDKLSSQNQKLDFCPRCLAFVVCLSTSWEFRYFLLRRAGQVGSSRSCWGPVRQRVRERVVYRMRQLEK